MDNRIEHITQASFARITLGAANGIPCDFRAIVAAQQTLDTRVVINCVTPRRSVEIAVIIQTLREAVEMNAKVVGGKLPPGSFNSTDWVWDRLVACVLTKIDPPILELCYLGVHDVATFSRCIQAGIYEALIWGDVPGIANGPGGKVVNGQGQLILQKDDPTQMKTTGMNVSDDHEVLKLKQRNFADAAAEAVRELPDALRCFLLIEATSDQRSVITVKADGETREICAVCRTKRRSINDRIQRHPTIENRRERDALGTRASQLVIDIVHTIGERYNFDQFFIGEASIGEFKRAVKIAVLTVLHDLRLGGIGRDQFKRFTYADGNLVLPWQREDDRDFGGTAGI